MANDYTANDAVHDAVELATMDGPNGDPDAVWEAFKSALQGFMSETAECGPECAACSAPFVEEMCDAGTCPAVWCMCA